MADNMNFNQGGISFNFESKASQSIIKVIGVGGGGGNAVNHMYREGIHDVTYVLCNTDKKALSDSPIPNHLQLGKDGLGAGNRPEKARQAAMESMDEIKEMLNDGTRMVFITAGMGGGTGTGAAPIIAQCAKDAGILTVGIVTIPFKFEGNKKINQALDGVEEISKHVDALLVINNERLREIYPELTVLTAFAKADDTLSIAAKSIAEIITMHGTINLDFQDVTTVLRDGGVAIMSTKVLLNINFCSDKEDESLMMEEMNEVHDFMRKFREDVEVKWGLATDSSLGNKVKITLLATGFGLQNVPGISELSEQQTREKAAIEAEEKQKEGERIEMYYGSDVTSPRRRRYVHIFRDDELDNDDIISMVETLPTYRRTKEDLNKFSSTKPATMPTETPDTESDGILTFNF